MHHVARVIFATLCLPLVGCVVYTQPTGCGDAGGALGAPEGCDTLEVVGPHYLFDVAHQQAEAKTPPPRRPPPAAEPVPPGRFAPVPVRPIFESQPMAEW